jgi:GDP-4-dehydro-6-deoxy-D-mannose reductase
MTILVTGSNGGLGKSLVPLIQAHYTDDKVVETSRSGDSKHRCDLKDSSAVHDLIRLVKPQIIFHLAASFTGDFDKDVEVNVRAFQNICESLIKEGLTARVIVFGSAAEYGIVRPNENPISEDHTLMPLSVYGLTKFMQTELAQSYARETEIEVVVARLFNLAIPGLSSRLFYGRAEFLINQFIDGQIDSLDFGNLDSQRDYIGLTDAAEQIFLVADHGISGEVYNVGSGEPTMIRTLLNSMLDHHNLPRDILKEVGSDSVGRKGYDVPIIYADIGKTLLLKNNSKRHE